MKLLILSTKLPYPPRDGGAIATLNLAIGLARSGMEVTMLTFNTRKHYFPPGEIPAELRQQIRFLVVNHDTSVNPVNALFNLLFSRRPYIAQRFRSRTFATELKNILESGSFDIVQLEGPYLDAYIPLIREHSPAKISCRAHNVEHEIWERRWKNDPWMPTRNYYRNLAERIRRLEQELVKKIDLLIPISDRDREHLLSEKPELKSITIPAGIDLSAYPRNNLKTPGEKDICFIGALDWAPNQEGLIWFIYKVLPHLMERDPDIRLHIAGRNAPERFIHKITQPSIVYHGEVEDAGAFMNAHRVMVAPLLSGSGIRVKILEGMARGMCVVTTPIGAEGIPAEHGKHLMIAEDGEHFAKSIMLLLNDNTLATDLASEARNFILEKFDTFTIASNLGDFYKQMT